jgi:ankyrin repeat protein
MLDILGSNIPLPTTSKFFSLEGIRSRAANYLFAKNNSQEVVVLKSSSCGKFKQVELKDKKVTNTFWNCIRKISYYTPLPLIARLIVYLIKKTDKTVAYYENPTRTTSLFIQCIGNKELKEAKAIYEFKNEVLQEKDSKGNTPFIAACKSGRKDSVEWIYSLRSTAVFEDTNSVGRSGFMVACEEGHVDLVKHLCELAKQHNVSEKIEDKDHLKTTAFMLAARNGHVEILKLLYACNGNSALKDTDFLKRTPFMLACQNGHIEAVKYLYEVGGDDLLHTRDSIGNTPFIAACANGNIDVIQYLYTLSGDKILEDRDSLERTSFVLACNGGHLKAVKYLYGISNGNLATEDSFIAACKGGHTDVIKYLYEADTKSTLEDKKRLVEKGYELSMKQRDNLEAIHYLFTAKRKLILAIEKRDALAS